jgi:hypothetical protein
MAVYEEKGMFGLAFVVFYHRVRGKRKTVWVICFKERYVVVLPALDLGAWNAWSDGSAISIRHDHPMVDIPKNGTPSTQCAGARINHHFYFSTLLKMSDFLVESRHRAWNGFNYVPKKMRG